MAKGVFLRTVLVLVVLFALMPAIALAQNGEPIQIISSSLKNWLQERMLVFTLEVKSVNKIAEMFLIYRVGNRQITTKVYPGRDPLRPFAEVTPRGTHQANFFVSTAVTLQGGRGIMPGSDIYYRYFIKDTEENQLTTQETHFVYEDNRFLWEKIDSREIVVYWYGDGREIAQKVFRAALTTVRGMKESGIAPDRQVKIWVYNSRAEMEAVLPPHSETKGREVVTGGIFFEEADMVFILGAARDAETTTAHELTHLLTHYLTDNPFSEIPAWLNEGLSTYAEFVIDGKAVDNRLQALNAAIKSNGLISLRSLSSLHEDARKVDLFYGESFSLVKYLIDTFGPEKMTKFLAVFKEGNLTEDALGKVYGISLDEFEKTWRESIGAPALLPLPSAAVPPKPVGEPTIQPASPLLPPVVAIPVPSPTSPDWGIGILYYIIIAGVALAIGLIVLFWKVF